MSHNRINDASSIEPNERIAQHEQAVQREKEMVTAIDHASSPEIVIETWCDDASDLISLFESRPVDAALRFDLLAACGWFQRCDRAKLDDEIVETIVLPIETICSEFTRSELDEVLKLCDPGQWLDSARRLSDEMDVAESPDQLLVAVIDLFDALDADQLVLAMLSTRELALETFPDLSACHHWVRKNVGTIMPATNWISSTKATFAAKEQLKSVSLADTFELFDIILSRIKFWSSNDNLAPFERISNEALTQFAAANLGESALGATSLDATTGGDNHVIRFSDRVKPAVADDVQLSQAAAPRDLGDLRKQVESRPASATAIAEFDIGPSGGFHAEKTADGYRCHFQAGESDMPPMLTAHYEGESLNIPWHPLPQESLFHTLPFHAETVRLEIDGQQIEILLDSDEH